MCVRVRASVCECYTDLVPFVLDKVIDGVQIVGADDQDGRVRVHPIYTAAVVDVLRRRIVLQKQFLDAVLEPRP